MRNMKKIVALFLTLIMVMGLGVSVMASEPSGEGSDGDSLTETYTITIDNDVEGHEYEAYQIFKGEVANGKLSNIEWGSGIQADKIADLGDAEAKAATLTDEGKAKAFAVAIESVLSNVAATSVYDETAQMYTISGLESGYYLIKDKEGSLAGEASSYTAYMLRLSKNEMLSPKSAVPTSYKKVDDVNDSAVDERSVSWQDSADYDIGDEVPFQLTGVLPENFGEYTSYKLIFHDRQSKGLTFNPESVNVYVKHLSGEPIKVMNGYTVKEEATCEDDACTFEIAFPDVRKLYSGEGQDSHISVTKNSLIIVEYTSTLNEDAVIGSEGNPNTMYMEYSNDPNNEGDGETGTTNEDTVIVFTYAAIINKTDSESKPLAGAAFMLEKKINGEWKEVKTLEAGENVTTFTFAGLDDGMYRLTETETPAGYNTIDPVYFEIIGEHVVNSPSPTLTGLRSNQITETGLTVTDNIIFSATVDASAGTVTSSIVNKSGTVLPETGGMGTTMFYLIGGILVVGAGVLLVTRKRMGK